MNFEILFSLFINGKNIFIVFNMRKQKKKNQYFVKNIKCVIISTINFF